MIVLLPLIEARASIAEVLKKISLSLRISSETIRGRVSKADDFSSPSRLIENYEDQKKILVAIDGSLQSLRALNYASNIFSNASARIYVLNVIEWADEEEDYIDTELAAKMQEEGKRMLRSLIVNNKKSNCERIVKLGDPATKISEMAEKLDVDMIVMGNRGLGNTKSEIGHVGSKVLKLTSKPIVFSK